MKLLAPSSLEYSMNRKYPVAGLIVGTVLASLAELPTAPKRDYRAGHVLADVRQ